MLNITDAEIKRKIEFQNPWWETSSIYSDQKLMTPRAYLPLFFNLFAKTSIKRAVVLMGPRRIGKTIMLFHSIQKLIDEEGVSAKDIIYFSIDSPNFTGMALERLIEVAIGKNLKRSLKGVYVFFDEIQYLKGWGIHLKTLVDNYPGIKFVASGSAAAALKLKSRESGAGRFTEFLLPPLTFFEFLQLQGKNELIQFKPQGKYFHDLNKEFINYLNYGGYPEAIFSPEMRENPSRFIQSDIIDKVLLRDLPNLYGIKDVQELYRLFTMLAFNTAQEVSLNELSKSSGVEKPTLSRYMEYLEAAFLIRRLYRIDEKANRFKRDRMFKVYLTNASMRPAIFGQINAEDDSMGALTETAIYSQMLHFEEDWHYARWKNGEVDFVTLEKNKPTGCLEVKWSDNTLNDSRKIKGLIDFVSKHASTRNEAIVTTRSVIKEEKIQGVNVFYVPSSFYCLFKGEFNLGEKFSSNDLRFDDFFKRDKTEGKRGER